MDFLESQVLYYWVFFGLPLPFLAAGFGVEAAAFFGRPTAFFGLANENADLSPAFGSRFLAAGETKRIAGSSK